MNLWGLKLDISAGLFLVVATGLAVDYASHVTHHFTKIQEVSSRNERVKQTLIEIGPAVFHGGFSTLLALILLCTSSIFVFKVFFRVFFLIVVFGLYNGLVLLPVILSLIGPRTVDTNGK